MVYSCSDKCGGKYDNEHKTNRKCIKITEPTLETFINIPMKTAGCSNVLISLFTQGEKNFKNSSNVLTNNHPPKSSLKSQN